jgi:hypothetical protein
MHGTIDHGRVRRGDRAEADKMVDGSRPASWLQYLDSL